MATATNMITTSCGSFMPEKPENYLSEFCTILTIRGEMNGIAAHSSSRSYFGKPPVSVRIIRTRFCGQGQAKMAGSSRQRTKRGGVPPLFFRGQKHTASLNRQGETAGASVIRTARGAF